MVLGAGKGGAPRRAPLRAERGSQALEFALVLPLVALALVLVVGAGLFAADHVLAQGLARDAARSAVLAGAAEARAAAQRAVGSREAQVDIESASSRPGDVGQVVATVRLRSSVLSAMGVDAWASARASMPMEPR